MRAFEAKDLAFRYGAGSEFSIEGLSLSIEQGSLTGLLGPNGSGKSTLLHLFSGLRRPNSGEVLFEGTPLDAFSDRERARRIAYVPQSVHFAFPLGVREIVEMGRHPHRGRFERLGPDDHAACGEALALCDARHLEGRPYPELSGGEKQRVLLASALAQTPRALLLDEPTVSLDLSHRLELFGILRRLRKEKGLTVLVATHELDLAARFLDRVVLMKEGRVRAQGAPEDVLTPTTIRRVLGVDVDRMRAKGGFPVFVPRERGRGRR
jgi:iron complex transport system ATP-binding protein